MARPWQGEQLPPSNAVLPEYDSKCYLCPSNLRANGEVNPHYKNTFTFVNDFPAVLAASDSPHTVDNPIIRSSPASGICKVICFSPRHDLSLAELSTQEIAAVIDTWKDEYQALTDDTSIDYVTIFENKGAMMGCSNPHPHGQIWATNYIPNNPHTSLLSQRDYFIQHGKPLISAYVVYEATKQERVVAENSDWIAVVPYWAEWPFEILVAPKQPISSLREVSKTLRDTWSELLKIVLVRYDNLFKTSFPYSMGIYQAPRVQDEWKGACLYQTFLPPLLRSASVRKYMVGFEMISESQRDITPEKTAEMIRLQDSQHFKSVSK
jgi:UDPglucose--hexose-1-phosphate uridylyltransferase